MFPVLNLYKAVSGTILISTMAILLYMILTKMSMIIVHEMRVMKTLVSSKAGALKMNPTDIRNSDLSHGVASRSE